MGNIAEGAEMHVIKIDGLAYNWPIFRWHCCCGWQMEQTGQPKAKHYRWCPQCPTQFLVEPGEDTITVTGFYHASY